jgi:hypothetical protein
MKKPFYLLVTTFLSVFLFLPDVKSDNRESASVAVNANILTALSLENISDVDFGNISSTTAGEVFLDPQGAESSYVGVSSTIGHLKISGDGDQSVRVGWPPTVELMDAQGNSITYTLAVSGNGSENQSTSSDLIPEGDYCDVSLNLSTYYLWIGGSLGTLNAEATGSYTGTAVFTVEYN